MILKHQKEQKALAKLRDIFWPRRGWKRTMDYYRHKILRIPASDHSIAAGLAIGAASSWNPLVGTHFLQASLLCILFKKNLIAGMIGTIFGNPWTFPFLWLVSYNVGNVLLEAIGYQASLTPISENAFGDITSLLHGGWKSIGPQILPVILGSYVMAMATFPLFYYPFYYMIKGARATRRARIYQGGCVSPPQTEQKDISEQKQ